MKPALKWLKRLILLLLVALFAWFMSQLQLETHITHHNPSAQAQSNPYLAAMQLLEINDIKTRRIPRWSTDNLPEPSTLIVLRQNDSFPDDDGLHQLENWLLQGGHLFIWLDPDTQNDQPLSMTLPWLGQITLIPTPPAAVILPAEERPFAEHDLHWHQRFEQYCADDTLAGRAACKRALCLAPEFPRITRTRLTDSADTSFRLGQSSRWQFPEKPLTIEEPEINFSRLSPFMLHLPLNKTDNAGAFTGAITVTTDLSPWNNSNLHYLDHAHFLLTLTSNREQLWFLDNADSPGLLREFWEHSWPLVITLLMMLIAVIGWHLPRRGAIRQTDRDSRQDFEQHLHAAGRLLWRHGQTDALLKPLRQDIRQRLNHQGIAPDKQAAWCQQHLELTESQTDHALYTTPDNPQQFTHTVAQLQNIRNAL